MKRKGFTLVELITVIAIIGVLIIIAVPIYNNMSGNTQEKAYENKVKLVEIAAANYAENFKNELKVNTEKVCVSINTLIKEEFLTSDGKNELYLTNPNLNGIEKTEYLMGSVELRYENEEIVAKYDLAGNCGIHIEKQIAAGDKYEIDITPPTGSMRIVEGDFTNNTRIHLELTLPDADAAYFCYSYTNTEECMIYKDIKDYNIKKIEYNLANNNDGVHHVFLWLKDKYGNVSNPLSDSILYDKVKPTGTITINNGNKYTNNPNVNLKFTYTDQQPASGVYEMCVSNTNTCPENGWESDKETRTWTLESIEGNRTVTVWFKDRAGNISIPYTAVIMLDTIKPTNISVFINGNAPYTNKATVTLTIGSFDATSGVEKMCISETSTCPDANWIDYATTHSMTLSGNDGQKFVYVKFRDRALNVSETTSDDIFLDRVDPTCTSHGDQTIWTKDDRTIHYGCADTNGSGCDPAFSGGSKLFNTTTKTFNIDPYTIKDRAGNKTDCDLREANVYVDKTKPTGTITLHNGASYTRVLTVNALVTYVESDSGIKDMIVSLNGTYNPNSWKTFASNSNITLNNSQGTQTVYLWLKDKADNISIRYSDSIIVDTNKPTNNTISINNGDDYTNSKAVTLTLNSEDTNPIEMCVSQVPACDIWVPFQSTMALTLNTPGEGTKTVYVKYRDVAGNEVNQISDTIILDTTPPSGSISINSGATYTQTTSVTLNISGSGSPSQMCVSNTTSCSAWQAYTTSRSWTLTSGDATKRVYIWFRDAAGNQAGPYSDTIILDTTAPSGSISINSGATYTQTTSVTLNISGSGSPSQMCVSNTTSCSAWQAYTTSRSWTLTSGDATKRVYIWFRDAAGNQAGPYSDTIILDGTPPSGSISINSGATYTKTTSVTLNISGSGSPSQMCVSNTTSCSAWQAYTTSRSWTLTSGDATKKVYIWFRDAAGNQAGPYSDTIILDTTAPSCSIAFTACSASGTGTCTDSNSGVKTGASASITANTTMSHSCEDNAGNTSSCSITKTYDACCTGSVVCVPGYKTCTKTSCCGTYCSSYGNTYECYQLTGGYGCGKKCASSTPTSEGQIWYKTTEKCCLSSEPATCTKECCGTDPCLTTTNSCIAGYK